MVMLTFAFQATGNALGNMTSLIWWPNPSVLQILRPMTWIIDNQNGDWGHTSIVFSLRVSKCWPFLIPPSNVQESPSRLTSPCRDSIILLVSSPTCQISLGIKLLAQQMPGNANLLLTLSATQSTKNWRVTRQRASRKKKTFRGLSALPFNLFYCCIPVGMLHAQEASHFFADIIRDATLLNVPQKMDTAESKDASKVFIFIEVLKKTMGFVKFSLGRNQGGDVLQIKP